MAAHVSSAYSMRTVDLDDAILQNRLAKITCQRHVYVNICSQPQRQLSIVIDFENCSCFLWHYSRHERERCLPIWPCRLSRSVADAPAVDALLLDEKLFRESEPTMLSHGYDDITSPELGDQMASSPSWISKVEF